MIEYKLISQPGKREVNEDAVRVSEMYGNYCFVVCDGLGGHGKGEEASALVSDEIISCFKNNWSSSDVIGTALEKAQKLLLEHQKKCGATFEMKTTAVVLTIVNGMVRWGYIGDSRLYYFSKNRLKERTVDHSVPQMLALAKDIKEEEIRFHPDRNKLLRVMGIQWGATPCVIGKAKKMKKGQSFLLCTDGFWEYINEKHMVDFLKKSGGADDWLNRMISEVEKNGAEEDMDNYTAITVVIKD